MTYGSLQDIDGIHTGSIINTRWRYQLSAAIVRYLGFDEEFVVQHHRLTVDSIESFFFFEYEMYATLYLDFRTFYFILVVRNV